ncbi:MAG TPA: EamA family transporter [Candidatus Eremiobacteraceae bacterium]|nr:EamA family transporter [Candidatus Eremiobacteraceae bacterium]
MQRPAAQPALVWAALLTVYVLWGSTYLAIRVSVMTMPPLLMAGARFTIAGLILLLWRLPIALRDGQAPTADHWRRAFVIGAALLLGGNGGVAFAETTVPSGLTALIVSTVPLWMMAVDAIFYKRKPSRLALVGLATGFGGVALLVGPTGGGAVSIVGAVVLVLASLSWAAGSIYSRTAKLPEDSLLSTGMEMLCGGLCLVVAGLAARENAGFHLASVSEASWIGFWWLVFFGGIVGFAAYLWVIRNAPTSLVSTYAYVNPIVAVALGWAILHEQVTTGTLVAGAVIIASVALIVSSVARQRAEESTA